MYYFEPVNTKQWNIFEKVKNIGHIEVFLATKSMVVGDTVLLHVGAQNKKYASGIYAVGTVITSPYILTNSPEDYCNNKLSVDVRIDKMNYSHPYILHEQCKNFINQFRTVHIINECHYPMIQGLLGLESYEEDMSVNDTQTNETEFIEKIEDEVDMLGVQGEEKHAYIKVRVNQSVFRERLLQKHTTCCLCKVENAALLRASHIKPWSESSSNEKLDVNNGLLLCPNHDALFDNGFISFEDNGKIMISERLTEVDKIFMNVDSNMKIKLTEGNKIYLDYHRKNIFK